jgi:hypothetical protein
MASEMPLNTSAGIPTALPLQTHALSLSAVERFHFGLKITGSTKKSLLTFHRMNLYAA